MSAKMKNNYSFSPRKIDEKLYLESREVSTLIEIMFSVSWGCT
jgi:hypothetical protein